MFDKNFVSQNVTSKFCSISTGLSLWSEVESRTQGSRPRPRTQKNPRPRPRIALPRTTFSRPRTRMLAAKAKDQGHQRKCSPKKKRSSKIFSGVLQYKTSSKIFFQAIYKISILQKKCCSRAKERAIFEDLRLRGQGQGLNLRGQGQSQDFKMCPRGRPRSQGRPRELHLCLWLP